MNYYEIYGRINKREMAKDLGISVQAVYKFFRKVKVDHVANECKVDYIAKKLKISKKEVKKGLQVKPPML